MDSVEVYGAEWCGDTQATLAHLQEAGVDFRYRDVDADDDADALVREKNGGKRKLPTVLVGSDVLVIPDDEELDQTLRAHGLMN